jgi:hypothetical protein
VLIFDLVLLCLYSSILSRRDESLVAQLLFQDCGTTHRHKVVCMKSLFRRSVVLAAAFAFFQLPPAAKADCLPPATTGIVICQPSPNSTVFQTPHFEAAVNPTSGSITSIKVLVDGKQIFDSPSERLNLFQPVGNGTHALLVDATDSFGRHYRASRSFSVIGNLPFCPPSAVGVRICSPAPSEAVSQNLQFSFGFKGVATISHVRIYMGSAVFADFSPPFGLPNQILGTAGSVSAGPHTMTVIAWDIHGQVYKNSVTFKAFFDGGCPPKGNVCTPVLTTDNPQDGDDVTSPFLVSAHVDFNSTPISAIKIYLNGQVVGASSGPTFHQNIAAAKGTHILVLQAWDVKGRLYRVTRNVNVQ